MNTRSLLVLFSFAPAIYGCGGAESPSSEPDAPTLLAPPPQGQGIQYQMVTEIGPGVEAQYCKFVQAPPEGLYINRDEVRFTAGSHHFLLYETAYTQIPTAANDGTPVDTSSVFDCTSGATAGWTVTRLIGGSQNGMGESMVTFPSDVAMRVEPNAVLLMNAHYINASPEPVKPEIRINLYTIPEAQVKQEGDVLFMYNLFIKVPSAGTATARMRCNINSDITLTNFQSHMHSRGVGYQAAIGEGAPFYTSKSWDNVPVAHLSGGMKVSAGSFLDYQCDYASTEAHDIYQGPTTKDEMCMAIGSYYPADRSTALCSADPTDPTKGLALGADWVGGGTATCAQTLGCIGQAPPGQDVFKTITDCVVAADPAVSKEVSDVVRCSLINGTNAATACQAQLAACAAK